MSILRPYLFLLICSCLALVGCSQEQPTQLREAAAGPYIAAVNNPLYYFAHRLIGDRVEVRLPVPADIDPAQWQPTVEELLQLQGAELVLLNGAGYSPWIANVSLASGRVVPTAEAASEQWIELQGQVTHSHGPEGDHAHGGYAFTTWMDMALAKAQAEAVAVAISARWPQWSEQVTESLSALLADIDKLDRGYKQFAEASADRQLVYSHPVYQYFERAYGLPGTSVHWEPDVMPSEEQWQELAKTLQPNALFIWEAEPAEDIAAKMNASGLLFVVIAPGANRSEMDWLAVQRANVAGL
ncbi:MAG: metal ABC transporter substrate-binding protein [Halieaceae bacterium]